MDLIFDYQPLSLYSVGHSLGGIIAVLTALDFEMKMNSVVSPSLYPQIKPQVYCITVSILNTTKNEIEQKLDAINKLLAKTNDNCNTASEQCKQSVKNNSSTKK